MIEAQTSQQHTPNNDPERSDVERSSLNINGAQALLDNLIDQGVEVCFANPGTSEMHLVNAIGERSEMRAILCLFEGVVTGAADGYGRMSDKPAITLLHLGPGYANGMANLHNAMRAHSPLINIVGEHATYHIQYDAPLTSDIDAHAAINSAWVATSTSPDNLAEQGINAVQAALENNGKVATLITPANHAWNPCSADAIPGSAAVKASVQPTTAQCGTEVIETCAALLTNGKRTGIILNGRGLRQEALEYAGQISAACDCDLLAIGSPARWQRGATRVNPIRIPYLGELAQQCLEPYEQIILVGTAAPVSFFAYPDKPSWLLREHCDLVSLATPDEDALSGLSRLAERLNANDTPCRQGRHIPQMPQGPLTLEAIGQCLNILMPKDAIVSDESITSGRPVFQETLGAEPHDWLTLTGGAIGQGLPVALGAAVACPDRKVIALQADGSAMYTNQSLWTMAREKLDITVVIFNNSSYAILNGELVRVGAQNPSDSTLSMLDLTDPVIDWQSLGNSLGVPSKRVTSAEEFHTALEQSLKASGPALIEAIIPSISPFQRGAHE